MKVVILGAAGGVGQALALLLKIKLPSGSELCLYDIASVTSGIAVDLAHIPTAVTTKGFSGKGIRSALEDANIVLISAGFTRKPGMNRSDLLKINSNIVFDLVTEVAFICPKACICMITNPVNTTVVIAAGVLKHAGIYEPNKLFGITTLDVIRANTFVAELKGKNPSDIKVPVIGGHSNTTILPLLSQVSGVFFSDREVVSLTDRIRNAGTEVVKAKAGAGSSTLSMGQAAARWTMSLVSALQGKQGVLEYAYVEGNDEYTRFFSRPLLLGKSGIQEYKLIGNLSSFEKKNLDNVLKILKDDIALGENFLKLQYK